MEREEQAAKDFIAAQKEAQKMAAEAETNDMSDGSHVDAPKNTPRKPRKLATS